MIAASIGYVYPAGGIDLCDQDNWLLLQPVVLRYKCFWLKGSSI